MTKPILIVVIREKKSVIFQGEVIRLSSYNEKGTFDIYPYHANFVAVISEQLELQKEDNRIRRFSLQKGLLRVKENRVEVYVGI